MVALNQASIYHWLNRSDCTSENLSVGYWQAARIQSLLGNAPEATRHAQACLHHSADLEPFYLGYAHEALARAALLAGDTQQAREHLALARAQAEQVQEAEHRGLLVSDLEGLDLQAKP